MSRNVLANAFSLNMFTGHVNIPDGDPFFPEFPVYMISVKKVQEDEIPHDCYSVVGHADTATVLSNILGFNIPFNRINYTVEAGDTLYVAQYVGPRLPEGATKLPDGAEVQFYKIERVENEFCNEDHVAICREF